MKNLFAVLIAAMMATGALAQDPVAEPATENRHGMPVKYPDLPVKERTYGFLDEAPSVKIVEPGVFEVRFKTATPTSPAILSGGINTLDEELDYPRFHYSVFASEDGDEPRTDHVIRAEFESILDRMRNTPYENRITYRVEVFVPSFKSTRFFEGRVYFDPETLGDAVNVTFGPFVDQVTEDSAVFFWETDRPANSHLEFLNYELKPSQIKGDLDEEETAHEIKVTGLAPRTTYEYRVGSGETLVRPYTFRTAGGDQFEFAAMVDSREGNGGGLQNFYGVNAFSLYTLGSDAYFRGADFIVFAGDLINGYTTSVDDYSNQLDSFRWIMGPVHTHIPIYESMGNHETLLDTFDDGSYYGFSVDKKGEDSAEAVFAEKFANPVNGPESEGKTAPTYDENVYYFDWGPARYFMLNNNYWWSSDPATYGGNLEGYIMENQMDWLREEVAKADADPNVRMMFFAAQEPPYPNGGHTKDAMWYRGGDTDRDGDVDEQDIDIVENRNEMWQIIASSPKSVAFITGDEHAYSRVIINEETDIGHKRLPDGETAEFKYPIWQVTSGGAGAPWYDKELDLPWSPWLKAHSTQPHYAYFRVDGDDVYLEAYSQTGQQIDHAVLREDGNNTRE